MKRTDITLAALAILGSLALLSCSAGPARIVPASVAESRAPRLEPDYQQLAQAGGRVFVLDPGDSQVRIYAFRGGQAARLGHNHVLSAPKFSGYLYLPSPGTTAGGRFDLVFRLDELEVDNPAYRATLGKAFASELSAAAVEGTREHMLGPDNLQADRFPTVRVRSLEVTGEGPRLAVRVEIRLHGTSREMWIPLSVDGLPDRVTVTGSFVIRQTDFGARPYSVLGGMLAVKDEVVVDFTLAGR